MADLDANLERIEKEERIRAWYNHRVRCLELAMKLDIAAPEMLIETAEKFSTYLLLGPSKDAE